jgi:hypothetical protein
MVGGSKRRVEDAYAGCICGCFKLFFAVTWCGILGRNNARSGRRCGYLTWVLRTCAQREKVKRSDKVQSPDSAGASDKEERAIRYNRQTALPFSRTPLICSACVRSALYV